MAEITKKVFLLGENSVRIATVGDYGVGKSTLRRVFCKEPLRDLYYTPQGEEWEEWSSRKLELDGIPMGINVMDGCGPEFTERVNIPFHHSYIRQALGVVFVYDVTNQESFDNLTYWLAEVDLAESHEDMSRILIGNKCDLVSSRQVEYNTAKEFADGHGIPYVETSTKNGHSVDIAFVRLAVDIKKILIKIQEKRKERVDLRSGQMFNSVGNCCYN